MKPKRKKRPNAMQQIANELKRLNDRNEINDARAMTCVEILVDDIVKNESPEMNNKQFLDLLYKIKAAINRFKKTIKIL